MQNKSGIYVFPMSLKEKIDTDANSAFPYVEISLVQQSLSAEAFSRGYEIFKTLSIFMPDGIKNTDSVTYGQGDLGMAQSAVLAYQQNGVLGSLANLGVADVIEAGKAAANYFSKQLAPSLADTISVATRQVTNPNAVSTLSGVNIRTFSIEVKLVPESKEESDQIREIENIFRFFMYPEKAGTSALKYPPTFRVKFMFGENENKYMPFYHDAYLESLDVQYNTDGNSYHKNGAPTAISVTMSFKEAFALTRGDLYNNGLDNTIDRDALRSTAYALSSGSAEATKAVIQALQEGGS